MSTYSRIANHHRIFHEPLEFRIYFVVDWLGVDGRGGLGIRRRDDAGAGGGELEVFGRAFGGIVTGSAKLAGGGL